MKNKHDETKTDAKAAAKTDAKPDTKTDKANEKAVDLDKKAEASNAPSNDGSFDHTPTAPQIETTAPANITSSPKGVDTKTVKFQSQSGDPGGPKTTIVEEAAILDDSKTDTDDRDGLIASMAVKAQSQGINQVADLGGEGVLTVFQDGTHSIDKVPEFEKDPE